MSFIAYASREREAQYRKILLNWRHDLAQVRLLEVGAGDGSNLFFFHSLGIPWKSISANELLDERVTRLRENLPGEANVLPGDAMDVAPTEQFDIVFVSTVFSSILDNAFRRQLSSHITQLAAPHALILCYDFVFNNPRNPDVRRVGRREMQRLFDGCSAIRFHSVTLAPPIGRRIGDRYDIINRLCPFLRTHVISEIHV
jgi:hypothetical protein